MQIATELHDHVLVLNLSIDDVMHWTYWLNSLLRLKIMSSLS